MEKNTHDVTATIPNYVQCSNCPETDAPAISWCDECQELICSSCVDAHARLKTTRNHKIKSGREMASTDIKCKTCSDQAPAVSFCYNCSEFICFDCVTAHNRIKSTKNHIIHAKSIFFSQLVDELPNLIACPNNLKPISIELTGSDTLPHVTQPIVVDLANEEQSGSEPILLESPNVETLSSNTTPSDPDERVELNSANERDERQDDSENRATEVNVDKNENSQTTNTSSSKSLSKWFSLSSVLNNSSDGKTILKYYKENNRILPKHRKKINKLILDKTFSIKERLTVNEREEIAQQISLVFHNENSVTYFGKARGKNGQILNGSLQAAYSYRTSKISKKRKRIDEEDIDDGDGDGDGYKDPFSYYNDEVKKSIQIIQQNLLKDDLAMVEWDTCFHYRYAKMPHYETLAEIFDDWPFFCRLNGFSFINHDFQTKFGCADILLLKWKDFVEENRKIIKEIINNPTVQHSLNELNVEEGCNEGNIVFCMALFHVPNIIQAAINFGKKRWRPTIKSSKTSVFKRVYSRDSIARAIRSRKIERDMKNIRDHPIIYGVGQYLDEMTEFYVSIGDVLFQFNSFVEALDASFKCFKVLRLDYPKESTNFWKFIDLAFYRTGKSQNSSSIMALINSLHLDFE